MERYYRHLGLIETGNRRTRRTRKVFLSRRIIPYILNLSSIALPCLVLVNSTPETRQNEADEEEEEGRNSTGWYCFSFSLATPHTYHIKISKYAKRNPFLLFLLRKSGYLYWQLQRHVWANHIPPNAEKKTDDFVGFNYIMVTRSRA